MEGNLYLFFRVINCRFHLFRSSAFSFSSQYRILFLKSSRSCVLLPTLLNSAIFPSVSSWRRQFLSIWPTQLDLLRRISRSVLLAWDLGRSWWHRHTGIKPMAPSAAFFPYILMGSRKNFNFQNVRIKILIKSNQHFNDQVMNSIFSMSVFFEEQSILPSIMWEVVNLTKMFFFEFFGSMKRCSSFTSLLGSRQDYFNFQNVWIKILNQISIQRVDQVMNSIFWTSKHFLKDNRFCLI